MVKQMERIAPTNELAYLSRGYLAALQGDKVTALEMIAKLDATHEQGWSMSSSAGYIYLALGDTGKFFEYMFAAVKDHTLQMSKVRYSPLYAEARKDPRYKELLTTLGRSASITITE